ncbi:MAG TPA: dTDP-4-dehydrorhamnose reductase [Candidatus Angelobacter sp.]|jgi:dTDP-4-dehydrorhamnose reductase|nr:dTDP-4-dehydrorhamnose reductase [Candidatus Angelobacter sp.]
MNGSDLKIVIAGRNGQLAWETSRQFQGLGQVICVGRPEFDLLDIDGMRSKISRIKPSILVNAAAYTAVDQAESEPEVAMKINSDAPAAMAEEAKRLGALFITYSTDYVFDGKSPSPYKEDDPTAPLNVYGASKLSSERAVAAVEGSYLIFRTSWVYGARGKNFLKTILKLAAERPELRIVDDQIGAPTWSRDLAGATRKIIEQLVKKSSAEKISIADSLGDRSGIYHMTAAGIVSWYGFATVIMEEMKRRGLSKNNVAEVIPIPSSQYPTSAVRPHNSRLCNQKLSNVFGVSLPPWREALTTVMNELANEPLMPVKA